MGAIQDNPLELNQMDIRLCIAGVRLVRDCGLLSDEYEEQAKKLLKKLELHEEEDGNAEENG